MQTKSTRHRVRVTGLVCSAMAGVMRSWALRWGIEGLLPRFQWSADQEPLHVVPAFTVTFQSGHGGPPVVDGLGGMALI